MLTMAQYAKERGVSKQAVSKAVQSGRLQKALVREGGSIRIDPKIAATEWTANTQVGRAAPVTAAVDTERQPVDYFISRAKREEALAEIARLECERQKETLVAAEDVKKQAFAVARQVRDGMLNIPDRVAAELASMTDQFEIHRFLTEEIRKALSSALAEPK